MTNRKPVNHLSRRRFLQGAASTALPALAGLSGVMASRPVAAAKSTGYKALVCVVLDGGMDSFNLIVPTDSAGFSDYQAARTNLALRLSQLLPISDAVDGRSFGLHAAAPELRDLFVNGNLGFVANVGTLLEPIADLAAYNTGRLPLRLFSHNDQLLQWQTALPQRTSYSSGWAGRLSDQFVSGGSAIGNSFRSIAVGQGNVLQTGVQVQPFVVDARSGATNLSGYRDFSGVDETIKVFTTDMMLSQPYDDDVLMETLAGLRRKAIDDAGTYQFATESVNITTDFPGTKLGRSFEQIATAIAARNELEQSRQIFYVHMPGWDHHSNLNVKMEPMVADLSRSMRAFYDATVELGVDQSVLTMTLSDFGRTLSTNGDGSDHGWGGNQMVMGGPVRGGHVYGEYPESLAPGNPLDVGRGRLIPTTSTDEYFAEVALWFGASNTFELSRVLPNIRSFYSMQDWARPIGFTTGGWA
ncbi:MAG: DUF1501 domain-containing protein [Gammaproteobacteria bacterium]